MIGSPSNFVDTVVNGAVGVSGWVVRWLDDAIQIAEISSAVFSYILLEWWKLIVIRIILPGIGGSSLYVALNFEYTVSLFVINFTNISLVDDRFLRGFVVEENISNK